MPLLAQALEFEDVDSPGLDDEAVTGRHRLERAFGQELPQLGDVDLDGVPRRLGRVLTPERVDEAIARDDRIRLEEQDCEQCTPLLAAERDRFPVAACLQRPKQAELLARHFEGLTTISGPLQRNFSAPRDHRAVNQPPAISLQGPAAGASGGREGDRADTVGGTAVALTAVPLPRGRRRHEVQQQLELRGPKRWGGAAAPPRGRPLRWLA